MKTYIIGSIVGISLILWYGSWEYDKGYQKALNEQNERVIEVLEQKNADKIKLQKKIKDLQNEIKQGRDCSTTPFNNDVLRVLKA